jgi:hypothetical protein
MLDQSYSHGASTKPLIGETLGANFDSAVKKWGDQGTHLLSDIKIFDGRIWNYKKKLIRLRQAY